jgi:hypothetical protein
MSSLISMKPKIDERIVLTADKVMILPRFDDKDVSSLCFVPNPVELQPAFTLQQAENFLVDFHMGPVLIVGHCSRSMKRESSVVKPLPFQDSSQKVPSISRGFQVTKGQLSHSLYSARAE